jgi:hypothetical protein
MRCGAEVMANAREDAVGMAALDWKNEQSKQPSCCRERCVSPRDRRMG